MTKLFPKVFSRKDPREVIDAATDAQHTAVQLCIHSKSGKIGGVYFSSPKKMAEKYVNCEDNFARNVRKS